MPHTGGSKSIGTLMAEKAKDGIEPTRAEIFILTHKKRKDGRPLDEESTKVVVDVANSGHKQASKSSQHEIDDQKIASPHDQKPVKSSPNHFNSEGVIAWETKSTSNQNSSWGASMKNKEIIIDPNHSSGWGKGGGKRDPIEHKIRSPSHNIANKIIKLQSSPTMIVKTEKNKQSMVQASELFSLLKLLRKENDESIRKTAAEALFKLSMED